MEGQQLAAVVPELVHAQQTAIVGEVTEVESQFFLGAVHLAEVQEGCQSVDLLTPVGLAPEIVGRVAGSTDGGRSERRDAVVRAVGEARVTGRDLSGDRVQRSRANTKHRSLGLSFGTDRNGDAGLRLLAALLTVHPVAEGADAGGERGEGQIVVVPLSKQGHHVSELRVADHAVVGGTEDVVGHLPHLRKERGVNHAWDAAGGGGSAVTGPTSGSRKLLMVLLLKPFGSEMPSSYSAGSQRANGVLEAPSRGFFLQPNERSPGSEPLIEKRRVSRCAHRAWRKTPAFQQHLRLQVVADAGDAAIYVDVGQGQALRRTHSG